MGLDLTLYRIDNKPLVKMTFEEMNEAELAYGRKTWAIADFFSHRCEAIQGDIIYRVTEEVWDTFMSAVSDLNDPVFRKHIEDFLALDHKIYEIGDATEEEVSTFEDEYDDMNRWLDGVLETEWGYQLGMTWELYAVVRWYYADDKVKKAFEDGADVILEKSY